ncbi:FAD-dependent oxidoreductase [Acuticoccus mangrovi]|uniref:GMC family oxidoreductase n=1 Tax=Acuticoccus mangrovi TaxID=2796142 RepID=A0A934MFP7_9HYPH|nr:GMC family oxidoreductase [Acuticoccus mangrovi]MBJ3774116.1 GMC family oxidoreductase [Acuticoccus mangrovi]
MGPFDRFADARTIETGTTIDADVCIIGTGAAGITIARALANGPQKVVMLETGGLNYDAAVAALGDIDVIGRPYPGGASRLRYLGGSTNHWGGQCAPLDPIVFGPRPWMGDAEWPVDYADLEPYYRAAHKVIGLGEYEYEPAEVLKNTPFAVMDFTDGGPVRTSISRYHRQRFGLAYAADLNAAPNVFVYLYATVTSFYRGDTGDAATHVTVATLAGNSFTVRATRFVLATGGIENARLLLDSNGQQAAGFGNGSGLVGRYFMEHVAYANGVVVPKNFKPGFDVYFDEQRLDDPTGDDVRIRAHLTLSPEATRALEVPRFRAELRRYSELRLALKHVRDFNFGFGDVWDVMQEPGAIWDALVNGEPPPDVGAFILANYVEQIPNPASRITLSSTRNALGQHIAAMDWRLTRADEDGIKLAHRVIAHEIGRSDFGRFRYDMLEDEDAILDGAYGGFHHMGTTRMGTDPKASVVDTDCRMHEAPNVYIAGSSLYPSAGWPNPTLTLVALAARLADHLKEEVARDG